MQKTNACEEAGQQDDEQGWFQPESEAQDRKQFDIAAADPARKSESGEEQQRKDHKKTDEGCWPIRSRKSHLMKYDTEKQQELKAIRNQQIEIIGNRYDQQQREHKGKSKQLQQVCCIEMIEKACHKTGNDFRSKVHRIYFCCTVSTFPSVTYIRDDWKKICCLQCMLAMDAVGACGGEVFFDGDTRSEYSEEGSENGSERKDGYVNDDDQNNSSLTNKLIIVSATSRLNLFLRRMGKSF